MSFKGGEFSTGIDKKGRNPIPAFWLTGLHPLCNALAKLLKSKRENVSRRRHPQGRPHKPFDSHAARWRRGIERFRQVDKLDQLADALLTSGC